jgi:hypothetical protein
MLRTAELETQVQELSAAQQSLIFKQIARHTQIPGMASPNLGRPEIREPQVSWTSSVRDNLCII